MKITLPSIRDQQKAIFAASTKAAIEQLQKNLQAPELPPQTEVDETLFPRTHLLKENEGWEPPSPEIIAAYFRHFQSHFPEFGTDKQLARLLRLSSDRRVREYKSGDRTIPYGVWREFLTLTGRAPQDIVAVLAFMG